MKKYGTPTSGKPVTGGEIESERDFSINFGGGVKIDFLPVKASAIASKSSLVVKGFGSASAMVLPIAFSSLASAAMPSTTKSTGTRFNFTNLISDVDKAQKRRRFSEILNQIINAVVVCRLARNRIADDNRRTKNRRRGTSRFNASTSISARYFVSS